MKTDQKPIKNQKPIEPKKKNNQWSRKPKPRTIKTKNQ